LITNALISELSRRRQGSIVDARTAEATLSGVIESLTWDTVSRKGVNRAAERRVYATLSLSLVDAKGNLLWKRSGLKAEQAYAVVEDNKPATENNRRNAVRKLSVRLAENVYRRLTDQF
jgi:outer membrane lipopolysaccharide assembly protein LptE/RlpB